MKRKESTAFDYFGYALYAFGGFGLEILLLMVESMIYNSNQEWTTLQHIIHWSVTSMIWGIIGYALLRKLPQNRVDTKKISWLAVCLLMMISIGYTTIVWGGWKPWIEFIRNGVLKFLVQYLYYAFEGLLIMLMIAHGQRAFESWIMKSNKIPFGGIMLAVTWGLIHILTQGIDTGIYTVIQSLLFGVMYLLLNKDFKLSCLVVIIMFMV